MTDNGVGVATADEVADERQALRELKTELTRFMMSYKFATDEMMTKINIRARHLQAEVARRHPDQGTADGLSARAG